LIIDGHGALHAIADNTTVSGREQNRRVEFELR
jgi:outer membrane protein OmpA-like peptidoglycan-associated protein